MKCRKVKNPYYCCQPSLELNLTMCVPFYIILKNSTKLSKNLSAFSNFSRQMKVVKNRSVFTKFSRQMKVVRKKPLRFHDFFSIVSAL